MPIVITHVTRSGDEFEVELPSRKAVCPRCDGEGKHVNPSIDSHGITREEFDEDPDFEEAYFRGDYDVTCYECKGANVVDEVDEDKLTKRQRLLYNRHIEIQAEIATERRYQERYGY